MAIEKAEWMALLMVALMVDQRVASYVETLAIEKAEKTVGELAV